MYIFLTNQITIPLLDLPFCETKDATIMSLANGHRVSKETWDSHNKMMLEPLSNNDPEVGVYALAALCGQRPKTVII